MMQILCSAKNDNYILYNKLFFQCIERYIVLAAPVIQVMKY